MEKHSPVTLTLSGVSGFALGACSKQIAKVNFVECSALCVIEHPAWCVAFYHNEEKKECRLMLYTDATIDVGDVSGWKKFVMRQ